MKDDALHDVHLLSSGRSSPNATRHVKSVARL